MPTVAVGVLLVLAGLRPNRLLSPRSAPVAVAAKLLCSEGLLTSNRCIQPVLPLAVRTCT